MEKFISIPVTTTGNQLLSSNHVVAVYSASATGTTTLIYYMNGKTATLTHAAQAAYSVRDAIQAAITASLAYNWTEPVYVIPSLPAACSLIQVA